MSNAPYEVIGQPVTLWVAPVATAFPEISATPTGLWTKIGTSGDLNYTEEGVTVSHSQSVKSWRALGSTGPRKVFREEEELKISIVLADLSLEAVKYALNENTVGTTSPGVGTAGYKKIGLSRGLDVQHRALLIRGTGASPYGTGWNLQFEIPIAAQVGEPEYKFVKGEPVGVALEFLALEDPNAGTAVERFGRIIAQNSAPGT